MVEVVAASAAAEVSPCGAAAAAAWSIWIINEIYSENLHLLHLF
jgi:hypothetical protein